MKFIYRGKVAWKFGDFVPGDAILGRVGMHEKDPEKTKNYVLTAYDPDFPRKFNKGDLMIAGRHFGGTRDHGGMRALKTLGVSCMVAESFSRPILRRCINENAFPVLECPGISGFANKDDEMEVNLRTGKIKNLTTGKTITAQPAPEIQLEILKVGEFIPYLRKKLETENRI